ncbi:MAG: tRNA (adenosine(37)-N6)-dimethylallyltransferase MiaA [Lentisphaeraceae bacterium]|nr:tRNA (adenosine(37)-N6)-dimethylallyltransferase MiaA [Lentisphaeraceae bacterium]
MPVLSILGPTASGKSSLAMILAKKLNGEIISCDSMQVYQGMDIGTAKPSVADREEVPHHLVDCFDIHTRYSANMFYERASKLITEIEERGRLPIIAGGTGMYVRLLLYGNDMPPADRELHAQLKSRLAEEGREALLKELAAIDTQTAERVKDNDRRLIRALEAVILTGEPVPVKASWGDEAVVEGLQIINMCNPELNRSRITLRTDEMLKEGWVEEVEALIKQDLWNTPTACQSLGYRQIGDYLNGDFESFEALKEKIITLTCRYAKRQRTWFRNQHPGSILIEREEGDNSEKIANSIVSQFTEKYS